MNRLVPLKTTTAAFVIAFVLAWVALTAQAVVPPPDGGYPRGNTAEGQNALLSLTTGGFNTATGWFSLQGNTTGLGNTADGAIALFSNTTGFLNSAVGGLALFSNTIGSNNTAVGIQALQMNTTGGFNTAIGDRALIHNTSGGGNTAVGLLAGTNVTTANSVICIGSSGADVNFTTWIDNVYGVTTQNGTTAPVVVSIDGQLGTVASSERFKKDIAAMEKASEAILSLRPVTFHYKTDSKGTPQFGLIAEEVATVNPVLVLPDREGKPYTVRYDAVNAMLLNEFLKEHRKVEQMQKQIDALTAGLQKVSAQLELSKSAPRRVLNDQ